MPNKKFSQCKFDNDLKMKEFWFKVLKFILIYAAIVAFGFVALSMGYFKEETTLGIVSKLVGYVVSYLKERPK